MNNGFDKQAFEKKIGTYTRCCVLIALIGVLSIVCSLFVGEGWGFTIDDITGKSFEEEQDRIYEDWLEQVTPDTDDDFGEDPKNYYGSYFSFSADEYTINRADITATGFVFTIYDMFGSESITLEYQYGDAAYANDTFSEDTPVIIVHNGDFSEINGYYRLIVDAAGEYTLEGNDGIVFTKNEVTFDTLMGAPTDYYGTYEFSEGNSLTVNKNGTASFVLDGEATSFQCFYANADYLYTRTGKDYDAAIILHNGDPASIYIFAICEDGNLILGDAYTFIKK